MAAFGGGSGFREAGVKGCVILMIRVTGDQK
jgi:hypothetical protein